jgi:hypothetical protein
MIRNLFRTIKQALKGDKGREQHPVVARQQEKVKEERRPKWVHKGTTYGVHRLARKTGFSVSEIAAALGCPSNPGGKRGRASRALLRGYTKPKATPGVFRAIRHVRGTEPDAVSWRPTRFERRDAIRAGRATT